MSATPKENDGGGTQGDSTLPDPFTDGPGNNGVALFPPSTGIPEEVTQKPIEYTARDRTVAEYLESVNEAARQKIARDIGGRIDLGVMTVGELVKELQPFVTENAPLTQIAQAVGLLTSVMANIQVPLDRADVHALVEYLTARLAGSGNEQHYRAGIQQSAEGLQTLQRMGNGKKFPPGDATLVAQAVFLVDTGSVLRDLKATARLSLLRLLALMMKMNKVALKRDMGANDFAKGVVSMAELEKDPSCLRIIFEIYEELSKSWGLDEQTLLRIWESFVRYFPITLAKAATDPSVPKPDELRALLTSCFTANDVFAIEAFPRLIDMLDTNQDLSANTKKDVFDTMISCVSSYGFASVLTWAPKIWESIKFEIWNGENEEFINGSLKVINALGRKLSSNIQDWDDELNTVSRFTIAVLRECKEKILDSKQRYMLSTGRIIYALASASPYMFSWVPKKVIPSLLTLWDDLSVRSEKNSLLGCFNRILQARIDVEEILALTLAESNLSLETQTYLEAGKGKLQTTLAPFKERLMEVYWSAMTESALDSEVDSTYRVTTIQGLALLMGVEAFLGDIERVTIIESLNRIILEPNQGNKILDEAITALKQTSMADSLRFNTITLTNFFSSLPRSITNENDRDSVIKILDSLVQISCTATCRSTSGGDNSKLTVFNLYQKRLLDYVKLLDPNTEMDYLELLMSAIFRGLEQFDSVLDKESYLSSTPSDHPYFFIVQGVFSIFITVNGHGDSAYVGLRVAIPEDQSRLQNILQLIGKIATLSLRSNQTTSANNFLNRPTPTPPALNDVWMLFYNSGVPESLDTSAEQLSSVQDLAHVGSRQMNVQHGPRDKCLTTILSMSIVAGVKRQEKERLNFEIGKVAREMVDNVVFASSDSTPFSRVAALQLLQLLVNKFGASSASIAPDQTLTQHIQKLVEDSQTNPNSIQIVRIYQVLAYFTAAALARCDPHDRALVSLMLANVSHPQLGKKVAQSFRMLLAPSDVLKKENFALVRPLRQGRLYAYTVEKLIARWRSEPNPSIKVNQLIALAAILNFLEPSVYLDDVDTIVPLLLEGTNIQNDDWTKLACITCIRTLVPLRPEVITSHLDSVINRMTDRTRNTYFSPSDSNPSARAAAIDVLSLLTKHVEVSELLKRKTKVMVELDIAVDDVSMVVRDRAQRCKLAWFNLVVVAT